MRFNYILIVLFAASLSLVSCKKLTGGGVIKEQGISTYMYGSHTIEIDGTVYAIKSNHINLNDYIDQYVTIHAEKVNGYPVDGGPELLEVVSVD